MNNIYQPTIIKNKKIKKGFEFSTDGKNVYKVTQTLNSNTFMAIWIGTFTDRMIETYNGFVKFGDFRLDQTLFRLNDSGQIIELHEATGVIGLPNASKDYKVAVGVKPNTKIAI